MSAASGPSVAGTMTQDAVLGFERVGGVAVLTLERPGRLNAIGSDTVRLLNNALDEIEADRSITAILVSGADGRFCAGADLQEIGSFVHAAQFRELTAAMAQAFSRLERSDRPSVAAVERLALGGGFELALSCDVVVAGRSARFGLPEIKLGLVPGAGGTQRLTRRVPLGVAKRLLLTGETVDAATAFALGLVSEVVDDDQAFDAALSVATALAAGPPLAMAVAKRLAHAAGAMSLEEGIALERDENTALFGTSDRSEGLTAFRERRPPVFTGS
jgi:enoyl-CoA hydratase